MAWYNDIESKFKGEDRQDELKMYLTDFIDYGFKTAIAQRFFDSDFKIKKRVNYVNSQFYRGFDVTFQKGESNRVYSHQVEFFDSLATLLDRLNENFKFKLYEMKFDNDTIYVRILVYSTEDEVDFLDMFNL
jgi:formyltetrahydrofolate synthetase